MFVFFRIYRSNITLMSVVAMMKSVAQLHMVDKQTFSVSTNHCQFNYSRIFVPRIQLFQGRILESIACLRKIKEAIAGF